jgi:subtilisin family serine protease
MLQRKYARMGLTGQVLVLSLFILLADSGFAQNGATSPRVSQTVREQLAERDTARVIVKLRTPTLHRAEGRLDRGARRAQRRSIASRQGALIDRVRGRGLRVVHRFRSVPYVALEVDAAGLARLETAGLDVERIAADRLAKPSLADSVPIIEGDVAIASGLDGAGFAIAILDTGIDKDHEFLTGAVVDEACFASGEGTPGDCPNGLAVQYGDGAGVPCFFAPDACRHGTHVAGIAAGDGPDFTGVAPGADLISIQVFHSTTYCSIFEASPCARAYFSDIAAGLEHVADLAAQYDIAAVNLSLGAPPSTSGACDDDDPQIAAVIDNLASLGVATVVASGNGAFAGGIDFPSCISAAISVGATTKEDTVAWFSNVSEEMDLFAPGDPITSSVPGDEYAVFGGTSMAAPHVAGAFAIMRQATPGLSVAATLTSLAGTGRPVTDTRSGTPVTKPRIRIGAALGFEAPPPIVATISPDTVIAWRDDSSFTITGTGFIRASVIHIDGAPAPTTYVSSTELTGEVSAAILATFATSTSVTVVTPPPGGGTSNAVPLTIAQPQLTVAQSTAIVGEDMSVVVSNNPGNLQGWIGLYAVGQANGAYTEFAYLGEGVTDTTWTVVAPGVAGQYEFRLFLDNGYTQIATSAPVAVAESPPPPPDPNGPSLQISAPNVTSGDPLTVTLTGGPGGASNWLALAEVGAPDSAYVQFTYVGAGISDTTWTIAAPSSAGQYEFRLFLDSSYTRVATSAAVAVTEPPPPPPDPNGPSLQISAPSVISGDPLTVTLAGGPGGATDWLALAEVGAPDSAYVQFTYVGAGMTDRTWTVNAPAPGQYEFRLFLNNGYERAATSATITVAVPPPPDPDPANLAVDVTTASPGESITVTLTGGLGGPTDWLALAEVGAPDSAYVQFTYVGASVTDTTWTVVAPSIAGQYEFRLFLNNGYERAATSAAVLVEEPPPPPPDPSGPSLQTSTPTVTSGDPLTVTLTGGPGGANDWLALAEVGAPDTQYVAFTYVGAGVTDTTWTIAAPAAGQYEFRLFRNNGYERAATSDVVVVEAPPPSETTLAVDITTALPGDPVTVTVTAAPGGATDWLALAATGAPDNSFVAWTYVGAGVTNRTWTVTAPTTPGDYEFRLFLNNGYERAQTSPIVTVVP